MHTLSPGWLPFIFFHEEQVISVTRKAGDLLFLYVYFIPESPENGKGKKVMNGVYLAYLLTDYGEHALTKIAVVK